MRVWRCWLPRSDRHNEDDHKARRPPFPHSDKNRRGKGGRSSRNEKDAPKNDKGGGIEMEGLRFEVTAQYYYKYQLKDLIGLGKVEVDEKTKTVKITGRAIYPEGILIKLKHFKNVELKVLPANQDGLFTRVGSE